jgi:hypothetical protein
MHLEHWTLEANETRAAMEFTPQNFDNTELLTES